METAVIYDVRETSHRVVRLSSFSSSRRPRRQASLGRGWRALAVRQHKVLDTTLSYMLTVCCHAVRSLVQFGDGDAKPGSPRSDRDTFIF